MGTCYESHKQGEHFDTFVELESGGSVRSCSNCMRTQVVNGNYLGTFAKERWTDVYKIDRTITNKTSPKYKPTESGLSGAYDNYFKDVIRMIKIAMIFQTVVLVGIIVLVML